MNTVLKITDKLRDIYADYDIVIRPVLKFGLAVMTFLLINNELGYMSMLNNLFVLIVLAVICAILPLNGTVLIGVLLIVAHCFGLGLEVGAFAVILYLLMLLLYFRFVPKDALAILLTPAATIAGVPAAVPLSLGQIRGPSGAFSVIFGVISWQFIRSVHDTIEPMKNASDISLLDMIQAMPKALLTEALIFEIIIFVITFLIVMAVRRLGGNYAYEKAIIAGAIVYAVLEIAGGNILGVEIAIGRIVLGSVGALVIAWILKLFYYSPDYSASENLAFEDDRYYYRVKVIPKLRPIDSRSGEILEKESEEEVPEIDTRRFRPIREEEIEQKFTNVDLQSELEHSLNTLEAKTSRLPGKELGKVADETKQIEE
ncbi:MAG: hypothetical protein IKE31_11235 [Eubacterium sp.]|nr:hypothetical protein [Eubacterium sp.]